MLLIPRFVYMYLLFFLLLLSFPLISSLLSYPTRTSLLFSLFLLFLSLFFSSEFFSLHLSSLLSFSLFFSFIFTSLLEFLLYLTTTAHPILCSNISSSPGVSLLSSSTYIFPSLHLLFSLHFSSPIFSF